MVTDSIDLPKDVSSIQKIVLFSHGSLENLVPFGISIIASNPD